MYTLILSLLLFFSPPTQDTLTVKDCLLLYGDSHLVYDYYARILTIKGRPVQLLGEDYEEILSHARPVAATRPVTDTGYRRVQWYLYEDRLYIAVFRHINAPGAFVEHKGAPDDWHLSCLLGDIDMTEMPT